MSNMADCLNQMEVENNNDDPQNNHHVKFKLEEEEFKSHHENLEIEKLSDDFFNVNLGYLKINHHYKIAFQLDHFMINLDDLVYLKETSSNHVTFKEMKSAENGQKIFVFIFHAYKEKIEKEFVYFQVNSKNGHETKYQLQICFEAKVLGANQGTPLLRNGITLLHHGHSNQPHLHNHNHNNLIEAKPHFNIV